MPCCAALLALALAIVWPGHADAQPRLDLDDRFLGFRPGFQGYDRYRGAVSSRQTFQNFGVSTTAVATTLDTALPGRHYEVPDIKYRVRLTLVRQPGPGVPINPSGTIEVTGQIYEADLDPSLTSPREIFIGDVTENIPVFTHGTVTSSTYFDKVTTIRTTGLGTDVTLEVAWWDGHEQEIGIGARLLEVGPEECASDYLVYFNGQAAQPELNDEDDCVAALLPLGAERGMYFGLDPASGNDAFFHYTPFAGHYAPPSTRADWLGRMPAASSFYFATDPTDDPLMRAIVVELERQADEAIVDAARALLPLHESWWGEPLLAPQEPLAENPGAFAQLSPRGLDRLEDTHHATLFYPLNDPGTQPRLADRAIQLPRRHTAAVEVNLADLPDLAYWTEPNPDDRSVVFAGHAAYRSILASARALHQGFRTAIDACNQSPPLMVPICQQTVRTTHCVDRRPRDSDFKIRVDSAGTYFDPARPLDALVVHEITDLDLAFGTDRITADLELGDIRGILEADIDPDDVSIEWDSPITDPCIIKPRARRLSEFAGTDYAGWLTCRDLAFSAGSGRLASPIPFGVTAGGEALWTPFLPFQPQLLLDDLGADAGTGTCGQAWFADEMEQTLLGFEPAVADVIEAELIASPGQDEALNRLLAPFELGIERVILRPPGTPPYEVHPLDNYALSAVIGATATDILQLGTSAADGLYVPYLTRAATTGGIAYPHWLCPVLGAQKCTGLLGEHPTYLDAGLDWSGQPFDVAVVFTTAHLNQVLWSEARRDDMFGSPTAKVRLAATESAVQDLAAELGLAEVSEALAAFGDRFAVDYHLDGVPYTLVTDPTGFRPARLIYVLPNLVVELVAIGGGGRERAVAEFLVDLVDRDHRLQLRTGGVPMLDASFGDLSIVNLTSTFLPGCYASRAATTSCDDRLRAVVGQLLWPEVSDKSLRMIEHMPVLHRFDAGQESSRPMHVRSTRTSLVNQGVHFFADLCTPGTATCP